MEKIYKDFVKHNCKFLHEDKIKLSKFNNQYKIYHNNNFICYTNDNIYTTYQNIKNYDATHKQQSIAYILCITNNDDTLINIILNQYAILNKFNVIIISINNNYSEYAIEHNFDYIICPKNDYHIMINNYWPNIKNSIYDTFFISNTTTLIHNEIIREITSYHKKESHISIPNCLRYVNLNVYETYNVNLINKFPITYWIIINKNFQLSLINNINKLNVNKINVKGTICVDKLYDKSKNNEYTQNEFLTLSLLDVYGDKINLQNKILLHNFKNVYIPQIIEINNINNNNAIVDNNTFKTYDITNTKSLSYNSIVNKFYFINTTMAQNKIINSIITKASILSFINNNNLVDANINIINDAITNNYNIICIVDGLTFTEHVFKVFKDVNFNVSNVDITILLPNNNNNMLTQFNNQKIKNFSYCINKNVFGILLENLGKEGVNVIDAINSVYINNKNIMIYNYDTKLSLVSNIVNHALDYKVNYRINYRNDYTNIIRPLYNYKNNNSIITKEITQMKYMAKNMITIPKTLNYKSLPLQKQNKIITKELPIIQSMFTGTYLNKNEINAISSFMSYGHTYHLYTYKPLLNCPKGCIIKNALEIMPYNSQLNGFKFKLLYLKGMYWVNIDTICTSKIINEDDYLLLPHSDAILKCPIGSKFALDCFNNINHGKYDRKKYIEQHNLEQYITTHNNIKNNNNIVTNYINKPINKNMFNVESVYGKYNNVGIIFYWMPHNPTMVNEMESMFNSHMYSKTNSFGVVKNLGKGNRDRVHNFIYNDIYIYIMCRMMELDFIDNIHIIFGMHPQDKYVYNNEPLFSDGNCYEYNDKITLWKLNSIKSILSFSHAKMYFYKGYGNYEHLYSFMSHYCPESIFVRYLATSFRLTNINNKIVIDNNWINNEYANNAKCKLLNKHNDYYGKHYTNYDLLLMDTESKIDYYKILFPNTKTFFKFHKYSLMKNNNGERVYDLMFCASDSHPSKNWDIFFGFLCYCNKNNKKLNVLIVSPDVSNKNLEQYSNFKNINTTIKKNLVYEEMIEAYNLCKCLLITFGRDATPRCMTEASKCGCYIIVLDILSDGLDLITNNNNLGTIIKTDIKQQNYQASYQSIRCDLNDRQYEDIYNLSKKQYDHNLISNELAKSYDPENVTKNIFNIINEKIMNKNKMVVTLATENYTNNLNYLLSSIKHTNPSCLVLVYCVGWSNMLLNQFKICYPNYYFKEINIGNYVKGDIIRLKVKLQWETYNKYSFGYLWIDADSVVLKKLDKIFDLMDKYTLVCYYRPEENHHMKFAVGIIMFCKNIMDNRNNVEFLERYYENSIVTEGYNDWFYDQTSLYDTYVEFGDRCKLYELGESEHSINDTVDTIVFSRRTNNKNKLMDLLKSRGIVVSRINFGNIRMKYN